MNVPGYTPGSWWVGVADTGCVALPGEADSATVAALWTSLRDGAGIAELLTVLLRPGIAAVPPFALVDVQGSTVHAVVRGDVVVEVTGSEGSRTLSGARMTTWSESVLAGVRGLVVRMPEADDAEDGATVPIESGVVRAGRLVLDLTSAAQAAPSTDTAAHGTRVARQDDHAAATPGPVPAPVPILEPDTGPDAPAAPSPAVSPALSVVRPHVPHPLDAAERSAEEESRPAWPRVRPLRPESVPLAPEPAGHAAEEADEAVEAVADRTDPLVTGFGTEAAQDGEDGEGQDHDGLTVLSSDVVALRRQLPEWAGDAVPSLAVPTPRTPPPAKLVLSTGLVVSLNRPVLLGRAPQVTRVSNNEIPRLVTLASPNQDISRTHAEVRMDGEDVVVTDLRSTNGVLLLRQGAGPQRLHPGEPTVVEPGVVVDLGEGATFLVEAGG